MVPALELKEVGEFDQAEMKRGEYSVWIIDHNQTYLSEKEMNGAITDRLIELMNERRQRSWVKKRKLCCFQSHVGIYSSHKQEYETMQHVYGREKQ